MAAPERWDEACFAVPALRALVASGLGAGVLCAAAQREFWETVEGLTVIDFPAKAKPCAVAAGISGRWEASLAWETGMAAEAFKIAAIPRRLGADERKLTKLLTHPLGFTAGPLEHRVRHYLAAVEEIGIETGRAEFFAPASLGIVPEPGAVLLCPDSDFGPSHEWPVERWVEIGRKLIESGKRVTVTSGDGGRGRGTFLAKNLGESVDFFQTTPLPGFYYFWRCMAWSSLRTARCRTWRRMPGRRALRCSARTIQHGNGRSVAAMRWSGGMWSVRHVCWRSAPSTSAARTNWKPTASGKPCGKSWAKKPAH